MRGCNSLIVLGLLLTAMPAVQAQQTGDLERIAAASQHFVAAIGARDINAMDKVWAHESYASFIGPLSTTVVVGWDGVRQAWQMRFGQFDRVTIAMDKRNPPLKTAGLTGCVYTPGSSLAGIPFHWG